MQMIATRICICQGVLIKDVMILKLSSLYRLMICWVIFKT